MNEDALRYIPGWPWLTIPGAVDLGFTTSVRDLGSGD